MYNPISSDVIRQTLDWMGLPKPTRIRRIDRRKVENSASYRVDFPIARCEHVAKQAGHIEGTGAFKFQSSLNEAFCDDIECVSAYFDYAKQIGIAFIRVQLAERAS